MRQKLTTDEKYMKQAIKQAKKAYAIDEVPIGCVIVNDADGKEKLSAEGITGEPQIRIHWLMQNWLRLRKQAKKWETGDWKIVSYM